MASDLEVQAVVVSADGEWPPRQVWSEVPPGFRLVQVKHAYFLVSSWSGLATEPVFSTKDLQYEARPTN